ncbi:MULTISPECIES: AMP-binding protein [unclassified Prochlorococcus]|uniref:AMP-binding protein n=1 Tax=unclassified Prochlorococcus TaxID=2627481 RepID=UPI00053379F0|nr:MULTISPECIES: AMP-binding protein [unclassified Prochlorococcus]KGG16763.1 O-succinylbenzoic acid--CoA ligase [Prochlorococcus sp. MIT 0602]KGG18263.1 O-succinylbenzoic acid--CoA ligase [Prochlorococcus sp. MIT 0603]
MKRVSTIFCDRQQVEECSNSLAHELGNGKWVELLPKNTNQNFSKRIISTQEVGIIINGGGSSGINKQCLHPCSNLDKSALATAQWLERQGLKPQECQIINPLPLHHVSGLLPWWRSRCWNTNHIWITPKLINNPRLLMETSHYLIDKGLGPMLTSLVPTQLTRLIQHPEGLNWLKLFSVIWVGGSAIPENLAERARNLELQLAPCYGTTETAAMVSIQSPKDFLSGINSLGEPLSDVELRIGKSNALQIRTQRLAKVLNKDGSLQSLGDKEGWWESGDNAELILSHHVQQLSIIGRRDTAINSGGEIIFPEKLQARLLNAAQKNGIAIKRILMLSTKDEEWGERLVALVRFKTTKQTNPHQSLQKLKRLTEEWPCFERPIQWHNCPELSPNQLGKWEITKWQSWLEAKES